jgi:hypothetical protein
MLKTLRPDLEGSIAAINNQKIGRTFSVQVESFRRDGVATIGCNLYDGGVRLGSLEHTVDQHGQRFEAESRTAELLALKLIHDATTGEGI